jgi:hydroxyethylthiazole kinase-like uncharacterized protein yjeF
MLKVLTAAQMREVDRLTTERYGIPSIILMENAAHAVARVITGKLGGSVEGKSILILCGPGNNGGDGAALARILWQAQAVVNVILFGKLTEAEGDARVNLDFLDRIEKSCSDAAANLGNNIYFFEDDELADDLGKVLQDSLKEADIVIDALLGTGVSRSLSGRIAACVDQLNRNRLPMMVSVDVPSGLQSDTGGREDDLSISATTTVAFTAPKPANILPPASRRNGQLSIASIGTPAELVEKQDSHLFLAERNDASLWLTRSEFTNASYKNKRGHALLIAGSRDYSGAAVLAGNAAIRSGCGLATIATPESSREGIVARVSPEVMVRGISQTPEGSAAEKAADDVKEFLKNVDSVAIGSGLSSKEDETKAFVHRIVGERQTPVIIDADGLTALSPWKRSGDGAENHPVGEAPPPLLRKAGCREFPLVLTPHEGEFKRLLGVEGNEAKEVLKDRVAAVRDFATKHDVILVLKGERALIGCPDGRVVVNPTGNSGLGKAGNGDTLTGIIAGFVAQAVQRKIDIFETVVAAVYIAGMAGDVAEKKYGKRVMTASDVRDCLVDVFEELTRE